MIYDYLMVGSLCLTALVVAGTLLGLPVYRRHLALSWLETPADGQAEGEPQR